MRICFLCSDYPPGPHGGIGTMTRVLGRALVEAGHQVRVAGVYPPSYPAPDRHSTDGIEVWRLREPTSPGGFVRARYALWKLVSGWVNRGEIDIVEAPDYEGWIAFWPRLAVPVMVRLHGSAGYFAAEMGQPLPPLLSWLERHALLRADAWISVSRYTAEKTQALYTLPNPPAAILYNPVETGAAVPAAGSRSHDVVFSGTLVEKKGVIPLIQAWPAVRTAVPGAVLHMYGKEGRTADGQAMTAFLRGMLPEAAAESVVFHGHVTREHLFTMLGEAGAAVFPSFAEAFAIAPLEAMTCGIPTVYSTRGSGPELIEHGVDGMLVDPGEPAQISDALIGLLCDTEGARRMGEAGRRKIVEQFSMRAILPQNVAFYEQMIAKHGRRR
ncbi:MAG: glycosyltransferase family 4 protein [Bryobacteraceae bacterium]